MATVTGLTLVKKFDYRGNALEEFSNKYWFKGPPPGNEPSWQVLMNDVVNVERTVFPADVSYVRAYGYSDNADDANHVFAYDFTTPGPPPTGSFAAPAGGHRFAGDQASFIAWKTDALSSRGKPIYLRKYFHAGYISNTNEDELEMNSYWPQLMECAQSMQLLYGGLRSQTRDLNVILPQASPWVTTRTLKHRGKRGGPLATRGAA